MLRNIVRMLQKKMNEAQEKLRSIEVEGVSGGGMVKVLATAKIIKKLSEEFPGKIELIQRKKKLGLGSAYKLGYRKAIESGVDIVVQMDADLSHSPKYIPEFLQQLENTDIVVGSRYIEGGKVDRNWNISRKIDGN